MTISPTSGTGARQVVGVGDLAVGRGPGGPLITFALGSCIGLTVYDPASRVGGLLHAMLASPVSEESAATRPFMFISTGVPELFRRVIELGARKERLVVCVAGAAEILTDGNGFQIGRRNRTMVRRLFVKNNIVVAAEDTGGTAARTMALDLHTGEVTIKSKRETTTLWPH